jgi:hypothetical protein
MVPNLPGMGAGVGGGLVRQIKRSDGAGAHPHISPGIVKGNYLLIRLTGMPLTFCSF